VVKQYARRSRSVLQGANAAPYARSARRKQPRAVDWTRLQPGDTTVVRQTVAPEQGYVVSISVNIEAPPRQSSTRS